MLTRVASSWSQIVLDLERAGQPLKICGVASAEMTAQMVKRALDAVLSHGKAIEVQLDARASEEIGIRRARQPFDLQVELYREQIRIDERAQPTRRGVVLGKRAVLVCGMYVRVDANGIIAARAIDPEREDMAIFRTDPQAKHDAATPQRLVGGVEVEIAMHGASWCARGHPEW
jgi:hypothetical protein